MILWLVWTIVRFCQYILDKIYITRWHDRRRHIKDVVKEWWRVNTIWVRTWAILKQLSLTMINFCEPWNYLKTFARNLPIFFNIHANAEKFLQRHNKTIIFLDSLLFKRDFKVIWREIFHIRYTLKDFCNTIIWSKQFIYSSSLSDFAKILIYACIWSLYSFIILILPFVWVARLLLLITWIFCNTARAKMFRS